jgi:hypothetical protein
MALASAAVPEDWELTNPTLHDSAAVASAAINILFFMAFSHWTY